MVQECNKFSYETVTWGTLTACLVCHSAYLMEQPTLEIWMAPTLLPSRKQFFKKIWLVPRYWDQDTDGISLLLLIDEYQFYQSLNIVVVCIKYFCSAFFIIAGQEFLVIGGWPQKIDRYRQRQRQRERESERKQTMIQTFFKKKNTSFKAA